MIQAWFIKCVFRKYSQSTVLLSWPTLCFLSGQLSDPLLLWWFACDYVGTEKELSGQHYLSVIATQWTGTSLTIHCFNILYSLSLQCFQGMVISKRIICLEVSKIITLRRVQYYWALSQLIGWIHESNYWVRLHLETISKNIVSSTSSVCLIS